MIRALQPEILINNRLPGVGDFVTPERFVPAQAPDGPWETCMTMNESWGYNPSDSRWKSARQLIHTLCEVAGRGGNLLLNVGPMGDGRLQPEALERFESVRSKKHKGNVPRDSIERWECGRKRSHIHTTEFKPWEGRALLESGPSYLGLAQVNRKCATSRPNLLSQIEGRNPIPAGYV